MSFKSILKKSLTNGLLQQQLSAPELIVTLLVTVFFAVYILILYRKMTKSTFYSRTFGISLVMLSVVTAGMILSMQANFVITFGMLGSLSLIRFRTSVKGTVDQIFIFWSVSVGLLCGASCYGVALAEAVILTAVLLYCCSWRWTVRRRKSRCWHWQRNTIKRHRSAYGIRDRAFGSC